jgi:hypothetical protein
MATYHGLIKVSCIACLWENENGSIVVSLTQEIDGLHTYDNLTMRG